jgi:hypothetical protein
MVNSTQEWSGYSANTEKSGHAALEDFGKTWSGKYPMIYQSLSTGTSPITCNDVSSICITGPNFIVSFNSAKNGERFSYTCCCNSSLPSKVLFFLEVYSQLLAPGRSSSFYGYRNFGDRHHMR